MLTSAIAHLSKIAYVYNIDHVTKIVKTYFIHVTNFVKIKKAATG